jgi:hypothetical protein
MQLPLPTIMLAFSLATASTGAFGKPVVNHQLSTIDKQQLDSMSDQFFLRLKASSAGAAVTGFLGNTELMEGKRAELEQLADQISTALSIYGPVSECIPVQSKGRGSVVEERQFICQHEKLATRWKLLFIKTTKGWIAGNLYFDDKVMSDD